MDSLEPLSAPFGSTAAADPTAYPAIDDFALIGDCRTAALVSRDGSIEWCCFPHFSGASVFAALLDHRRGGRFAIRPKGAYTVRRRYLPGTAVLETTFETDQGVLELTDAMPVFKELSEEDFQPQRELLRRARCTEGRIDLTVTYEPRPEYATRTPKLRHRGALGWSCSWGSKLLHLHSDASLALDATGARLIGEEPLSRGESRCFSLTYTERDIGVFPPLGALADQRLDMTRKWWEEWSDSCSFTGRYAERVRRSAITLKLLTFTLSGAIVAAPTTSLPEKVGGIRNWDYRYCWLRDAAMTLRAFFDLNYVNEGEAFLTWLLHATRQTAPELDVLYDVYGHVRLPEQTLDHLEGYRGSRPVRIGNGAWDQVQLDVYGEVVLAAHDYLQRGGRLDRYECHILEGIGNHVANAWQQPDKGLWELRGGSEHHTHSKVMCWVVLNRLIRLAEQGHLSVPMRRFRRTMKAIERQVEAFGYDAELGSYTATFDSPRTDAALMLLARYGFRDPTDPRLERTFDHIDRTLGHGPLIRRYPDGVDHLPAGEGAFAVCGFWAVDYLARAGRLEEAERRFEQMITYANDLGLFSEEYDPATGAALGNFPQAFTHIGLITAALSLARARGECHFED